MSTSILPRYVLCGCCEQYHRRDYWGDCRNDAERFNPEDLDAKHGVNGWIEIPPLDYDVDPEYGP